MTVKAAPMEKTVSLTQEERALIQEFARKAKQARQRDLSVIARWDVLQRRYGMNEHSGSWSTPEHKIRTILVQDLEAMDVLEAKVK